MQFRPEYKTRLEGIPVDLQRAMQALRGVIDPGLGENIVELGLIEALRVDADTAELLLVSTQDDCPLSDLTADEAFRALQRALPERDLFVRHDAEVDWVPERMSPGVRSRLAWIQR
jgi:metal-sulfur cluster biosynthetic enzyme